MKRIAQWFVTKPYTKAMYLTACSGILMALMSAIMVWTVVQNQEALKLTVHSLKLQESEFRLRNRPLIDIREPEWSGSKTGLSGGEYPQSIRLAIVNVSDVPANKVRAVCVSSVNGSQVSTTVLDGGAISRGADIHSSILLPVGIREAATNRANRFVVEITTTYSGMLGEANDEYQTYHCLRYEPTEESFKFYEVKYK